MGCVRGTFIFLQIYINLIYVLEKAKRSKTARDPVKMRKMEEGIKLKFFILAISFFQWFKFGSCRIHLRFCSSLKHSESKYIFDLDIEKKFLFFSSKNNKVDIHYMTAD